MKFNPYKFDLPITDAIPSVKKHLSEKTTLILNAPPGAGKSTLLPPALLDEEWLKGKKIIMLEPRRLAAKTIAERMAFLLEEEIGQTVGYRIRFENKCSNQTRIEVVTEGILTRMLHSDKSLSEFGLIIFDEFHERSIFADVAMALSREAQLKHSPTLRILIMSATLDMPQLSTLLKAPVVESMGRQYPVDIRYTGEADEALLPEMTAQTVIKAAKEESGDILVFLPGEAEIKNCEDLLKKQLKGFAIHPLYGQLPSGKQYAAIMPDKSGKRKVVLATSIAETSLTIEGISVVVDSGFGRTSRFDPQTGLSRLETIKVSKDSADQRAGRAGRLGPGVCYRMWSKEKHESLVLHRTPEILEADLSSLVLDLALWGITNADQLFWLTPPPKMALMQALQTLHQLGALENGKITYLGKMIHTLPCHPRIANMLLKAEEDKKLGLATDLAAILEERDPLPRETGIDINLRIIALRKFRKEKGESKKFRKIEKIAASYRALFNIEPTIEQPDSFETGLLLAACYPERIAFARPGNNAQFKLANGHIASAHHKDSLAHEPWLTIASMNAREGMGRIFLAAPLNPKDLAPLVKEIEVVTWNPESGSLSATKDLRIGSIILKSVPLPEADEKFRIKAISEAIAQNGEALLNFNTEVKRWQKQVLTLKKLEPQENWPDVSTHTLLLTNHDWLAPYLQNITTGTDLKKINLMKILPEMLTEEQKNRVKESQMV